MNYKRLWIALGLVLTVSFAVLGGVGYKVLTNAPPIPSQVVLTDGRVLFEGTAIENGQGVWQSIGGQEVGTIWGHGSYVAPDWTADWLHRECTYRPGPRCNTAPGTRGRLSSCTAHMNQLRCMRMFGDSLFAIGVLVLGWFVLGLITRHSYDDRGYVEEGTWEVREHAAGD